MTSIAEQTGRLDATELSRLVKNKEVSEQELLEGTIERLEKVNGKINAVITPMYEEARIQADRNPVDSVFLGVPFLIKDFLAEIKGVRFTEGSAFLGEYVPGEDSELIARFRNAGLLFVGKTNTPEFAIGATTEPARFGATRNPWDTNLTSGGSSGGSAAAVAARVVPMAHGNDAAGSIRIPASCCGLVGLKPSRGRVSLGPLYGDVFGGIICEFALTRSVRDTASLLDAVSGPVAGDPYSAPAPVRPYAEEIAREPKTLRIGFSATTPLGDDLHPDCEEAVRDAAKLCETLGHEVEERAPEYNAMRLWNNLTTILASGVSWTMQDWSRRLAQPLKQEFFEPFVWAFSERGRSLSSTDYLLAVQDVQAEVRNYSRFFETFDLWLTPTLGQPPVPLGTLSYDGDPVDLRRRTARFSPFTYIANATGQPAISLPLYWSRAGVPIGVHFTARTGGESTLLRIAAQLEQARPWVNRLPSVCAV
ncbi:MAG: amidase [Arenicellales bacterium]|nr:amidase [Arenicellales bacterium]